jgi:hypothetical protein
MSEHPGVRIIFQESARGAEKIARVSHGVQNCGDFLYSFPVRVAHHMPVDFECSARVDMSKLPLDNFRRGARLEQERRVRVAKGVKATPLDLYGV